MTDDSGEVTACAQTLGIMHPPGYPLYSMLGRLALFPPVGTPALRLNLMAAFFALAALFFILRTGRLLLKDASYERWRVEGALVVTAFSFLSCQSLFAQCLTAKGGVYTLTLLNLSVLVWVTMGRLTGSKPLWVLYFWSVGIGSHWQTQVLWLVLLGIRFYQSGGWWTAKKILTALSLVLAGFSVYLYLPLRAALNPALNPENPRTLNAFLDMVLRRNYTGEEFALRDFSAYAANFLKYVQVMLGHWWPGFVLLVILGFWFLLRRNRPLAMAWAVAYGVLVLMILQTAHFQPDEIYLEADFLVSTQVFPALLGFLGIMVLVERLRRFGQWVTAAFLGFLLSAAVGWGTHVFQLQDKSRFTLAEDYGVNTLKELPHNALLLADTDIVVMPEFYLKYVRGLRPDVAFVPLFKLYAPWGWEQVNREYGDRMAFSGSVNSFQSAMAFLTDPTRFKDSQVFYTHDKPILERSGLADLAARFKPWGLTDRLEAGDSGGQATSLGFWNVASFDRLRNLDIALDLPGTEYSSRIYPRHYARRVP
ncbi:MAG TPA: DUF2723 domain-containing protein [bacterium]|nr:DUF2723 domain-containing protein [bacterium]